MLLLKIFQNSSDKILITIKINAINYCNVLYLMYSYKMLVISEIGGRVYEDSVLPLQFFCKPKNVLD